MLRTIESPPRIAPLFTLLSTFLALGAYTMAPALAGAEPGTKSGVNSGADEAFPSPEGLAHQVSFWIKVYTIYTTSQAVIHDSEHLDVIYGVEQDLPARETTEGEKLRKARLEDALERYTRAVERLAAEPEAEDLTELEQAVKAAWGDRGSPAVYAAAAERVRLQVGQADRFREGIQRSGAYLPRMRQIMAELELPEELLALPHVESSFDPGALSHRGASGIWQWTRGTGRQFMRIDRLVDERRDPFLATRAAGLCLKQYYEELASWPLAITAYNHGIYGMRRAANEHGTDIARIVREYDSRSFKFASRNFYAEFLAALEVSRNHEKYFGPLPIDSPLDFDEAVLKGSLGFKAAARLAGVKEEELAALNPALLSRVRSGKYRIPHGYALRLPAGKGQVVAQALAGTVSGKLTDPALIAQDETKRYHVQRGDTLSHIARRFGTDVDMLLVLNNLDSHRIYAGQTLLVPAPKAARN